jgi:hypothetical protein
MKLGNMMEGLKMVRKKAKESFDGELAKGLKECITIT